MGKGSKRRPTADTERFNSEFDRIFNKPKEDKADAIQESERPKATEKRAGR